MGGAAKPISEQQLYSPLRIWCIGLAITAIGVIASDLWLDQPIALFVHRTVADKTIFVWLQRLPVAFFLLSSLIFAWCGLWTLLERPLSRARSIGLACSITFIATNLITNQLKYAFGRLGQRAGSKRIPLLFKTESLASILSTVDLASHRSLRGMWPQSVQ